VGIIGQLLTPVVVAVTAAILAYALKKRGDAQNNRTAAIQVLSSLLPHVASSDAKVREIALLLIRQVGEGGWGRALATTMRVVVQPVVFSEGPADVYKILGWVRDHLALVWSGSSSVTGIVSDGWLLYPGRTPENGVAFWAQGMLKVVDSRDVVSFQEIGFLGCRLGRGSPSLAAATATSGGERVALIGYRQMSDHARSEMVLVDRSPSEEGHGEGWFLAESAMEQAPLGWMAVSLREGRCVGVVGDCRDLLSVRVVALERVMGAVRGLTL
jgi:hypothetical protein